MTETLVARWTLPRVKDGHYARMVSDEEVNTSYPEFAAEVIRLSKDLEEGTPVSFYWQKSDTLQQDMSGVVACLST